MRWNRLKVLDMSTAFRGHSFLVVSVPSDSVKLSSLKEFFMKPSSRSKVNKSRSAAKFRGQTYRTKGVNMSPGSMRGGIRL